MPKLINPSLDAISSALDLLGNPQNCYQTIHIAGTNGKGSVCTFLELLYLHEKFRAQGSGLGGNIAKYISPHVKSPCERMSVNGIDISEDDYHSLQEELFGDNGLLKDIELTYFEQMTALAFEYFKRMQVDIAILEVGMGGRWDATNIVASKNRLATAITNVSLDHMAYLGDTVEKIRIEKEAIKRDRVPHFELTADSRQPTAHPNSITGENFRLALDIFESINNIKVSEDIKIDVLNKFKSRYKARFEYNPDARVLADAAHNPAAMEVLNRFIINEILSKNSFDRKIFVLAFLNKDYQSCLENLFNNGVLNPDHDLVILTELDSDRATPAYLLDEVIDANKLIITNPSEAIAKAQEMQGGNDLIVISGSVWLGEFKPI